MTRDVESPSPSFTSTEGESISCSDGDSPRTKKDKYAKMKKIRRSISQQSMTLKSSQIIRRSSSLNSLSTLVKSGATKARVVTKGILKKGKKKLRNKSNKVAIVREEELNNEVNENCSADSSFMDISLSENDHYTRPIDMDEPITETTGTSYEDINIMLLVQDGKRFELLQLVMKPNNIVSEIVEQISQKASDKKLRKVTYIGVCNRDGEVLEGRKKLADYFDSYKKDDKESRTFYILFAILKTMKLSQVITNSTKILQNPKFSQFFQGYCGDSSFVEKDLFSTSTSNRATKKNIETVTPAMIFGICAYLLLNFLTYLYIRHTYLSTPLSPSTTLSVGEFRTSCGLINFIPDQVYVTLSKMNFLQCETRSILMFDKFGLLTMLDEHNEIALEIQSKSCKREQDCTATITDSGELMIGDEKVTKVKSKNARQDFSHIYKWAFTKELKLLERISKKKKFFGLF